MEGKSINRFRSFCNCLEHLRKSVSADPKEDFVLEGTVLMFMLAFDISWKVMKDILMKELGILGFAIGSPRETLKQAFINGVIADDQWMAMLTVRNQLAHDYDGAYAAEKIQEIVDVYVPLFDQLKETVGKYYSSSM